MLEVARLFARYIMHCISRAIVDHHFSDCKTVHLALYRTLHYEVVKVEKSMHEIHAPYLYFIYCRKSTEDEDHQAISLESHQIELSQLAEGFGGALSSGVSRAGF
jgi:hypothetical protein